MTGEGVQFQVFSHQSVQAVKAFAHVTGRQAQIHSDAARQVHHARKTVNTVRSAASSTPRPMRSRSPVLSTSSNAGFAAVSVGAAPGSTNAKRTGSGCRSRFRQT